VASHNSQLAVAATLNKPGAYAPQILAHCDWASTLNPVVAPSAFAPQSRM